jgi:hypothetical protein
MASPDEVEQLQKKLGVARGTLTVGWIGTAFDYFRDVLRVDPLDPQHLQGWPLTVRAGVGSQTTAARFE